MSNNLSRSPTYKMNLVCIATLVIKLKKEKKTQNTYLYNNDYSSYLKIFEQLLPEVNKTPNLSRRTFASPAGV